MCDTPGNTTAENEYWICSGSDISVSQIFFDITNLHILKWDILFDTNYKKVIKNISEDLNRWTALPLSLIGRVESIRMNAEITLFVSDVTYRSAKIYLWFAE